MKKLNIMSWEKVVQQLNGKRFELLYGMDMDGCYRLTFKSVKTDRYYQMSIDKEARPGEEDYQVWIFDRIKNISYPLSIAVYELANKERFTNFLDSIVEILDTSGFGGSSGDSTTNK